MKEDFQITRVSRDDLEGLDYEISKVDDDAMEQSASKMTDAYCETSFSIDLPIIADHLGIPKK